MINKFDLSQAMRVAALNYIAVMVLCPGVVCMMRYGYIPNRSCRPLSLVARLNLCSMRVNLLFI